MLHGDPISTIALIDTGIQVDDPEFANKPHSESHSVLLNGPPSNPSLYCDRDTSRPPFGYTVNAQKAVTFAMKLTRPADWNIETLDAALYLIDYTNADVTSDLNRDTIQTAGDLTIFLDSHAGQ
ncbi:MAG: hypothetical protein KJZ65_12615 [Phycisphaerales bacterium]|nr:hypothetical protein [Phycisphaerales bacterium]